MKALKVLSLFDGISCGMVALERAGITVERYVAYEIEKNAIKISLKNYPQIEQCGDVTTADFTQYEGFDLLIGGSPCQSLSITRGEIRTNLDGKSKLFFEYARALKEMKPKYFLFENVASMNQESKEIISEILGCEPIFINSNCFVAQDRPRYYWTNIPVDVSNLKECNKCLQDVMEEEVDEKYFYTYPLMNIDLNRQVCAIMDFKINEMHKRIFNPKYKVHTLTTCAGGNLQKKVYVNGRARKLTPLEYERLQGLPDYYTEGVANTHRYNAIGNGWTVDVIAHIFTYIKKKQRSNDMELKINDYQLPEKISFNYEEIKSEVAEKVKHYANLVYTEDQIKDAKSDRATLNKFVKALEDKRKEIKKQCLEPYEKFEAQMKEIIAIVNEPIAMIDNQVKEYEELKKSEKLANIQAYFDEKNTYDFLKLDDIMNHKWLNASVSMKSIQEAIDERLLQIAKDIATLSTLPEFGFEATEVYKTTLDVNKAINEAKRMSDIAKAKAEAKKQEEVAPKTPIGQAIESIERQAFEQCNEQPKQWVSFSALLSTEDALALKEFFNSRNIQFKAI